jgi:hypothetical protein
MILMNMEIFRPRIYNATSLRIILLYQIGEEVHKSEFTKKLKDAFGIALIMPYND